jgi:hypothetical protein
MGPLEVRRRGLQVGRVSIVDCPRVSAERVALIPQCAECDEVWLPAHGECWEAYLTADEPPELAFYCPSCAERELGRVRDRASLEGALELVPERALGGYERMFARLSSIRLREYDFPA